MIILSFDVGIKNLAFCLIDTEQNNRILDWDVADLTPEAQKCSSNLCKNKASYHKNDLYYCTKHAKSYIKENPGLSFPPCVINKVLINEMTTGNLRKLTKTFGIQTTKVPLDNLRQTLCEYIDLHFFESIVVRAAKDIDLIEIGLSLHNYFTNKANQWSNENIKCIDLVLIENQISPIANRMKTIQGMLAQFFITSICFASNQPKIKFVSSSNKLKDFTNENTTYDERKKLGVEITRTLLNDVKWLDTINTSYKKDDLADCYLQAIWYISHKDK